MLVSVSAPTTPIPPGANRPPAFTSTLPPWLPVPPKMALPETVTKLVLAAEFPFTSTVPPLMVVPPV